MLMIALRVEAGLIIESLPLMTHRLSRFLSLSLVRPCRILPLPSSLFTYLPRLLGPGHCRDLSVRGMPEGWKLILA